MHDLLSLVGRFKATCRNRYGAIRWTEDFDNIVCVDGKTVLLNAGLAGSSYTVVGPYMGLISGTSFTAVAANDTMTSHPGWLEAGNANAPQYSGNRPTCVWAAAVPNYTTGASVIALSAGLSFTFTANGTVEGALIVLGSGATNTVDNTGGSLLSAGVFTQGARSVFSADILTVSYSLSA